MINLTLLFTLVATLTISSAQRPETSRVVHVLRDVEPYHRHYREFIINEINKARLNMSDVTSELYRAMTDVKQEYVKLAVDAEKTLVDDVNRNTGDPPCLGFLRTTIEHNMYMAGIYFSNCIDDLEDKLDAETQSVYLELQHNEKNYVRKGFLDVFHRENIVLDPETISYKLEDRKASFQQVPKSVITGLTNIVDGFRDRLVTARTVYTTCLVNNRNLLQVILDNTKRQLNTICRHGL
ncbi:uncharacterized protein LOC129780228 [Toxorhynchites rutilus septentrionalis]|uniref:uncharacterized protein LOC129780228 n=1 Tax=Toxorhynchites rutilus septentrionalis TaxID=329112 RepID=UPI0024792122|nr:uncharacterized protein LOC129780228 [Toxorhynchites rutilus septentrionalis]